MSQKEAEVIYLKKRKVLQLDRQEGVGRGKGGSRTFRTLDHRKMTIVLA
jgi:hypothetical protein